MRKPTTPKGKLIVFEGPDGAGKTTVVKKVAEMLQAAGQDVLSLSFSNAYMHIPEFKVQALGGMTSRAVSSLYAAGFWSEVYTKLIPALEAGKIVLCDRYFYTAIIRNELLDFDIDWTWKLFQNAPVPDMTVYLNVSAKTATERLRKRMRQNKPLEEKVGTVLGSGTLLGTIMQSSVMLLQQRYDEHGEPLTPSDRRKMLKEKQRKMIGIYNAFMLRLPKVRKINAEQDAVKVFLQVLGAVQHIIG